MKTREVLVGNVGVGGDNPIRIQSMTTSKTSDIKDTIDQIIRLSDKGCEIVRVTVQGIKEADSCEGIKGGLIQRGYTIPLVADIHFFPRAAMRAVDFVDKIRINPGNYVDKRASFKVKEYDDALYCEEIKKIEEKFTPLVEKCKKLKRSMRIGVNHGSLSDRIMNRYGNTPNGMVESAIEFARICRKNDYHDFIFSMKSSNPKIMISAYRLLVSEMTDLGWDYPLHLGVTEAGEGEDGRIKSAIGIGSLLLDGIGNTIRVSLTEDPCNEIDPCKRLIAFAKTYKDTKAESTIKQYDKTVIVMANSTMFLQEPCIAAIVKDESPDQWSMLEIIKPTLIFLSPSTNRLNYSRQFFNWLKTKKMQIPIIINFRYECSKEEIVIQCAAECGALFCDGLGDGLWIQAPYEIEFLRNLSLNILQASRMKTFKTDFISCPGCGRTLFDIQDVSKRIRSKISHLPGIKIAIMGCIVNGPGEMSDADFGYVGSKPGVIDLYVGKQCVEKEINSTDADDHLIDLIKKHGRWVEP